MISKRVIVYNFSGYRITTYIEYFDNSINRTDTKTSDTLTPGDRITFKLDFEGDVDSYEAYLYANGITDDKVAFLCGINIIDSSLTGTQDADNVYICIYNGGSTGDGCNPEAYLVGTEPSGYLIKDAIKYESTCAETITINSPLIMIPIDNDLGTLILDNFIEGKCENLDVIPDPPSPPSNPPDTNSDTDTDSDTDSDQLTGKLILVIIIVLIIIIIIVGVILIGGGIYFYKKISNNKKKNEQGN